jgi:PhnB protein
MAAVNPYLNFNGTTEEAFNFYKSVFGGEFLQVMKFKETPEKDKLPAEAQDKIMHISLPIGNGNILMGTDALECMGQYLKQGNNFHLSVEAESKEEADKYLKGLSAGGKVTMPLADTFWGAYFGMTTDKYGVNWMISYDKNRQR